jgi:hypothetical protein
MKIGLWFILSQEEDEWDQEGELAIFMMMEME